MQTCDFLGDGGPSALCLANLLHRVIGRIKHGCVLPRAPCTKVSKSPSAPLLCQSFRAYSAEQKEALNVSDDAASGGLQSFRSSFLSGLSAAGCSRLCSGGGFAWREMQQSVLFVEAMLHCPPRTPRVSKRQEDMIPHSSCPAFELNAALTKETPPSSTCKAGARPLPPWEVGCSSS